MQGSIDWDLLKFLYEVHGATEEELAEENGTTLRMVEFVRDKQGWKRSKLAKTTRQWSDLEEADDEVVDDIQQKMAVSSLLKQFSVNPKLQLFEVSIIAKAIDTVRSLDPAIPSTAESLQKLGSLLEKLKESNPAIRSNQRRQEAESAGAGTIKVQIITGYAEPKYDAIDVVPQAPQIEHSEDENDDCVPSSIPVEISTAMQ